MEIKINKGQIITSVCLAVAGWFAVETYYHAQRFSALEEDKTIHERHDRELQEIRKSIQDMTVLFFQEREQEVIPTYENSHPNQGFNVMQQDLRNLLDKRKGK